MSNAGEARKSKEQKELEKTNKELQRRRIERESQAIRKTFATDEGRRCLKQIMDRCKYQSPITTVSADGVVHSENLQHNAALQGLYLWLRKHVDNETLIAVEVQGIQEDLKGNDK